MGSSPIESAMNPRHAGSSSPLAVLGPPHAVCDLALRRTLRAIKKDQSLIVVDYQGTASRVISPSTGRLLEARRMT